MAKSGAHGVPWYWKARDQWFTTLGGKRVQIRDENGEPVRGENGRPAAIRALKGNPSPKAGLAVGAVLTRYLAACELRQLSPKTLTNYRLMAGSFNACWPALTCDGLTPRAVERWLSGERWTQSTRHLAISFLKAALNWASSPGKGGALIPHHPLRGLVSGGVRRRSAGAVVTEAEFEGLLKAAEGCPPLVDLMSVAWETGCRPVTLRRATAKNVVNKGAALLFDETNTDKSDAVHKTFKRTGRPQVVPLTAHAAAIVARLAAEREVGPLFLTATGLPWTDSNLAAMVAYYAAKVGLKGRYTPYSSRHTRATQLLEAGVSLADAAAILGNSPAVLARHYAHLVSNPSRLSDLMERAKLSRASADATSAG